MSTAIQAHRRCTVCDAPSIAVFHCGEPTELRTDDHAAALRQLLLEGFKLRTGPDGKVTDVTGAVRLWQPNGDAARTHRMAWFDLDTGELT